jgi:two-component system, OmpR family, response regulator
MPTRVLLVEDDARVAAFVRRGLESEGYAVDTAADGPAGLAMARAAAYPLILLDRRLPTLDGLEVCRALREEGCGAMVLMLTARGGLQDRVEGLRGGADDYLAKPFAFDELLARMQALLRRAADPPSTEPALQVGDLRLDPEAKRAWRGGCELRLTKREFALLAFLMANAGAMVSRERLLSGVWQVAFDPGSNLVDVYVRYLRRKLGDDEGAVIQTVRGFGYRMPVD